ncbi:MAG: gliding motility lipoprotein GldH [Paludibacter sp.]|nr:gliding motility lipoprotein GldH [Bacteroidales bacterium]MCM1068592.1 gliding motility lipoprotein GldH [Prevotella sp.]MCM1353256.1 gliding motility lipoprotein GldH [Bacteroides sp.]MCM1442336.1 gliding motility lipoprotein GldH [Muribaculum sp.]MCM1481155.1 gliding motility lipoprotein GldH [Paludibacter sp.]
MQVRDKLLLLVFPLLCCVACEQRTVYSEIRSLPLSGWNADSVLHYEFEITDTATCYNVLFYVRHTQQYPYQNMWLFVNENDTIEFYLADQRGRWLGNGWGNLREMPVLYKHKLCFPHSGTYSYDIRQGMREECLYGINDVGIKVEKCDGKE